MNALTTPTPPSPSRSRWRWYAWPVLAVLTVAAGAWVWSRIASWRDERLLAQAIARTAARHPHWRMEDRLSQEKPLPDDQNGALRVVDLQELFGFNNQTAAQRPQRKKWFLFEDSIEPWESELAERRPARLDPLFLARFRAVFREGPLAKGLEGARQLTNVTHGKFPHDRRPLAVMTLLPHVQGTRSVAQVLEIDAWSQLEQGRADAALDNVAAQLGLARSFNGETFLICGLVRQTIGRRAVATLERTLACAANLDPERLRRIQADLLSEAANPLLTTVTQDDRAVLSQMLEHFQKQGADPDFLVHVGLAESTRKALTGNLAIDGYLKTSFPFWFCRPIPGAATLPREHAALLDLFLEFESILARPEAEQWTAFAAFQRDHYDPASAWAKQLTAPLMGHNRLVASHFEYRVRLRAAAAACAAERFRLARGRWPADWPELVPAFLPNVPVNPFAHGRPLVISPTPYGRWIRRDSATEPPLPDALRAFRQAREADPSDGGFRLWHPDQRYRGMILIDLAW